MQCQAKIPKVEEKNRSGARSIFNVEVEAVGDPVASSEVLDTRWLTGKEIGELCQAPYHDSFKQWSRAKAGFFSSDWTD